MKGIYIVLLLVLNIFGTFAQYKLKQQYQQYEDKYNIIKTHLHHPQIVFCQAVLETGWFKSYQYRVNNNSFGLLKEIKDGKEIFFEFKDFEDCVTRGYRDKIQYKYTGGDYYEFLKRINYATAENYIKILKQLENQIFENEQD